MTRRITSSSTVDTLKKEAKRWLNDLRAGDERARARLLRSWPDAPEEPAQITLRDVQFVLAREHDLPGWSALTEAVHAARAAAAAAAADTTDSAAGTDASTNASTNADARAIELIQPKEFASDEPFGDHGSRGSDVWAALLAARAGDTETLRALLARDPRLALYEHPLHYAVREGHLEAVRLLLDAGGDADRVEWDGESLVTVARDRGHEHVARLLESVRGRTGRALPADRVSIDAGVDVNADVGVDVSSGVSAVASAEVNAAAVYRAEPIHELAAANDVDGVRRCLDANPRLIAVADRKGALPLHRAAQTGARAVIELLLDRGADIHARHGDGAGDAAGYPAPDHEAIDLAIFQYRRGDFETARLLLRRGATYDLPIAAAFGDLAGVAAMLDANPDRISESRPYGKRALSAAVEHGHEAVVRLLLERGADPTWSDGADSPRGASLWIAAWNGNTAIVELLLDHGADPNAHMSASGSATSAAKTPELRRLLYARGGTLDCYDLIWVDEDDEVIRRVIADPREAEAGCGGVFTAAATRHKKDLVIRLIEAGIRVPPMLSACRSYLMDDPDILRLLLTSGAMDPNLPNWKRQTPLHDLCGRDGRGRPKEHRVVCSGILLDAGANINARDEEYRSTPLAWAARNNLPDMVEVLLARGAPTNLPDDEPWATPLSWASRRGHTDIEALLRAAGGGRVNAFG